MIKIKSVKSSCKYWEINTANNFIQLTNQFCFILTHGLHEDVINDTISIWVEENKTAECNVNFDAECKEIDLSLRRIPFDMETQKALKEIDALQSEIDILYMNGEAEQMKRGMEYNKQAEFRCTEDNNAPENGETDSKTTSEMNNNPIDIFIQDKPVWFQNIHIKLEEGILAATSEMDCVFFSKFFGPQEKLNKNSAHLCDNKDDLKEHKKNHEDPESFLCNHCAIQCTNKEALSHCIKSSHQDMFKSI